MKKSGWLILPFVLLGVGCHCRHTSVTALQVPPPAITQEDHPLLTPQTPAVAAAPATQEKPAAATSPAKTAPATSKETTAPATAVKTVATPAVSKAATTKAAAAAAVAAPALEKTFFKDEPRFPLADRRLNPLVSLSPTPDTHRPSPWKGEQLKFGIYYSFIKAGTAYIKNLGLVENNHQQAYVVQTTAFSASAIDSVFKVRDVNLSWLEAEHLYSLGYSQSLREGNYKRDEWVIFDYDKNSYRGELQKKAGPRSFSGALDGPVLDILTSLYYVRSQRLVPGQEIVFNIINREEKYPLVVKITGRETVKTSAGKFKCVVAEPQFRGEGIFVSKGKNLKIWLTDDAYKMPVKMKADVFIGSVSAELLDYKRN